MISTHRASTTAVLIACLLGGPSSGILFANEEESSSRTAHGDVSTIPARAVPAGEALPGTTEFARSVVVHSPHMWRDDTLSRSAFAPDESSLFAQRGGRGRGYRGRHNGAAAAIVVGAAAAIAGTAVLVYANRPECSAIPTAGGCGYGTKVVGGAVLSAGVVGLLVGAAMWR
jgi:hypothetical protein